MPGEILGPQIGQLPSLKEIAISSNYFSGSIATEIGHLKNLGKQFILLRILEDFYEPYPGTNAYAYHCSMHSIVGDGKTVILNAGINDFSGKIPQEIVKLTSLQQLWLEETWISGELPQDIENMTSLGTSSYTIQLALAHHL